MKPTLKWKASGNIFIVPLILLARRLILCWVRSRDGRAAKRFFRKALKANHACLPRVINVDKNERLPKAIDELKTAAALPKTCELRQNKYLNNIVELRTHRFIKRLANPGLGFQSFYTAIRTIIGCETMNQIRKGQILGIEKGDILAQAEYARSNFWSCCIIQSSW